MIPVARALRRVVALLAATAMVALAAAPAPASARLPPARARLAPPPVVVVMLENREDAKLNAGVAPYLTSLKTQGRYFSSYYSPGHPSFANYLAFAGGSTFGFKRGKITPGMIPGDNLWSQLADRGTGWGVFEEVMPNACFPKPTKVVKTPTKDKYGIGHNPGIVFEDVYTSTACQQVEPLTAMPATPPPLSFVTPSFCNDMHGVANATFPADCQKNTDALIERGDAWLRVHVEAWRASGAIVIVTFDEGNSSVGGTGGHLYTVEVGPSIEASVDATTYNHYSLLAGLEDRFGVPRLRNAVGVTPLPIG
jgi:phosphatidylinositol-3-phosphatase